MLNPIFICKDTILRPEFSRMLVQYFWFVSIYLFLDSYVRSDEFPDPGT